MTMTWRNRHALPALWAALALSLLLWTGCDRGGSEAAEEEEAPAWHYGTTYHVFVHSFADGNGDGIGDFDGLIQKLDYIDEMRDISDERAFEQARAAAQEHGMPIGPSAGAALAVGIDISANRPDARVVTIICDGGEQYFDTLFGV
jgi:hypothetical protein